MKWMRHDHGNKLPANLRRQAEMISALSQREPRAQGGSVRDFRKEFLYQLAKNGWTQSVRLSSESNIKITAQIGRIALCFQTGNVGRFYADLLKLQMLSAEGLIDGAFLIVPTKRAAKKIGSNVANYDRLKRELAVFRKVITVPLVLFGIEEI